MDRVKKSKVSEPILFSSIEEDNIEDIDTSSNIENEDIVDPHICENNEYLPICNKFKLKKELQEYEYNNVTPDSNSFLYPTLNDRNFNIKIATKKEFNDTKYDGTIYADVKQQAEMLSTADFELSPHQAFVKNFMSFQTPYNSLLLYHGLGSGKTCSAIGVSEEMRDYLKQMNSLKRIIIVASENVQDNFRLQLLDEKKLKNENGVWNINNCIGNKLLREINPTNLKEFTTNKIKIILNFKHFPYHFTHYILFFSIVRIQNIFRYIKDFLN